MCLPPCAVPDCVGPGELWAEEDSRQPIPEWKLQVSTLYTVTMTTALVLNPLSCRHMVFGHKSSSQYLVAASASHLQVWDLLSCSGTDPCVCGYQYYEYMYKNVWELVKTVSLAIWLLLSFV